jgi:prepilin peptidase CpaA
MHVLEVAVLTVMPGAVALAAALDLFTMKIPNRISVVMVLAFLPLGLAAGLGPWEFLDHVGAGLIGLLLGVLLFIRGWFGGGDAKLMAAIALWIGLDNLLPYMLYVALAGGVIVPLFTTMRSVPLPRLFLGQAWAHRLHNPDAGIPYGIALAAGALLVYPQTVWFAALAR